MVESCEAQFWLWTRTLSFCSSPFQSVHQVGQLSLPLPAQPAARWAIMPGTHVDRLLWWMLKKNIQSGWFPWIVSFSPSVSTQTESVLLDSSSDSTAIMLYVTVRSVKVSVGGLNRRNTRGEVNSENNQGGAVSQKNWTEQTGSVKQNETPGKN